MNIVLSATQVVPLQQARQKGLDGARVSLDLNLSHSEVGLGAAGVALPDGQELTWADIKEIEDNDSVCYLVEDSSVSKIQTFSDAFNRFYALMPTSRAPTLMISGIPMHRVKGTDPQEDTRQKIKAMGTITGRVLDTCTGLGYTAIAAARFADQVTTIELDPAVLQVAALNPWSQALFESPRIEQLVGDALDCIMDMEDQTFARILHDPPRFSLAGHLYSTECYRHLWRVLKPGGRMFHYIGDPDSRSGRNTTRGVLKRLQEAGFSRVVRRPAAFGVMAYKR